MIWGPFFLALALGLLVSAGLYFAYLWPQVEPEEPVGGAADDATAETAEAAEVKAAAEGKEQAKAPAPPNEPDEPKGA